MSYIVRKFFFKSVDKILDTLVSYIQKLDRLAELELERATVEEAEAQKLVVKAAAKREEAERAFRVSAKIKGLVS